MGRHSPNPSYGHHIQDIGHGDGFIISWTVDFYYSNSRLRWPRNFRRLTDTAGARRFVKKWDLKWPE